MCGFINLKIEPVIPLETQGLRGRKSSVRGLCFIGGPERGSGYADSDTMVNFTDNKIFFMMLYRIVEFDLRLPPLWHFVGLSSRGRDKSGGVDPIPPEACPLALF